MTITRGLALALTLAFAAPAAAAQTRAVPRQPDVQRDDQRRPDVQRNDQRNDRRTIRPDLRDGRDTRDAWNRRVQPKFNLAFLNGQDDGYEAGLKDRRKGDRFDPIGEKRYRSADHGYNRRYGPKDLYKNWYREGFRRGYQEGYQDGGRGRRDSDWWWPFGGRGPGMGR